ncbi:MAG: glycosyltransferase [Oscillospiraceae bacterium]|nr:glycosyltransferase [Oscillospiraceae bacterium]
MTGDLISVVVTVHNTKLYLRKCIGSILGQTYGNLDIILVDDGSTDGCAELCDMFRKTDKRIRVIHQSAKGAAAARAEGMRIVRGKFVHFVDDDDWMDADMEEKMMQAQDRTDADVVISRHIVERGTPHFGGSGKCPPGVYDRARMEREIFPGMMSWNNTSERGIHPNLWMKLFRTETVRDAILRVDPRILKANDVAACYEALYAANKIVIIPERYYHYRLGRPKSITTSFVAKYYESMQALLDHLLSSPMAQRPEIARQIPRIMRSCLNYGMQGGCGRNVGDEAKIRAKLMSRLSQLEQNRTARRLQAHQNGHRTNSRGAMPGALNPARAPRATTRPSTPLAIRRVINRGSRVSTAQIGNRPLPQDIK